MTEVMQEQLSKQMKTAAKKQLYFGLASILSYEMMNLAKMVAKSETLIPSFDEEGLENKAVFDHAVDKIALITLIYQVTHSLKMYRQAFGEYPEFIKFFEKQMPPQMTVEKWVEQIESIFRKLDKTLSLKGQKKLSEAAAFGELFAKHCEVIKLKGEV